MNLQQKLHKNKVGRWLFIAVLLLIVGALITKGRDQSREVIVAWGMQDEISGTCLFWIIDPADTNKSTIQSLVGQENCNYQVVEIDNRKRLINLTYPGKITIYEITNKNNLVAEQIIDLGNWGFSSVPQWGTHGEIYFSSTVDGVERIFQANVQSKEVKTLLSNEGGLAAEPLISPNGRYLVYWTLDGPTNRTSQACGLECSNGYYHVYDIVKQTDLYLPSLLASVEQEPNMSHCNAQWSPTGQYLAFSIGCSSNSPQRVIIFDVETNEILTTVEPDSENEGQFISLKGWLSEKEVVCGKRTIFPEMNFDGERYYVYSLIEKSSRELVNLPAHTEKGQEFILMEPSWTLDSNYYAGTLPSVLDNGEMGNDLVIINADDFLQFRYVYSQDKTLTRPEELSFNTPRWSISGDWIAYHSTYREETASSRRLADLGIVDRMGTTILPTGVKGILEHSLRYAWIEP